MVRRTTKIAGFAGAMAGAALLVAAGQGFGEARPESFDARWIALGLPQKHDRLAAPQPGISTQMIAVTHVAERTTVLTKVMSARRSPVREMPPQSPREDKIPVGCEPSFSPVAAPALAHIVGRCDA